MRRWAEIGEAACAAGYKEGVYKHLIFTLHNQIVIVYKDLSLYLILWIEKKNAEHDNLLNLIIQSEMLNEMKIIFESNFLSKASQLIWRKKRLFKASRKWIR